MNFLVNTQAHSSVIFNGTRLELDPTSNIAGSGTLVLNYADFTLNNAVNIDGGMLKVSKPNILILISGKKSSLSANQLFKRHSAVITRKHYTTE